MCIKTFRLFESLDTACYFICRLWIRT